MTDARSDVLARVRVALGETPADVAVPREYRVAGAHAPGSAAALDLLVDRLVDYKAHVVRVAAAQAPEAVGEILGALGTGRRPRVVVPDGLDAAWLVGVDADLLPDSRTAPLSHLELDAVDAVVTAARIAVADTGTIVLDGEPDQGRRAISLLPDVHVCVVRAEQVVQTVPEAVRVLAEHAERPQTWISGPSATSDIELDRVEGVHGPRTLHVLLVG
ncbi:LutC/YkgG family protein [Xylanimonas protaetiae]|uniref:Lactate utilization protein C n=1 Tax=Xylanimonas protaetiae TaxID=2509457 RepID=A0A4P6F4G4_9MICO|nr:lactate utilization protein C [Xylanimonas protaetiae]QAY70236.1 lactate utilization protein C [Xylanimonas protaetiae]